MKPVSYEEGQKLAETHTCTCGGKLTLCWGGSFGINSYVLQCAASNEHSEIMRPAELGTYDIPGFNLYNLKGRYQQMVQELGVDKAKVLQTYEQVAALTKDQASKILQTIWPDAPGVEILKAAIICRQYGLNPLMKHIFLLPFKKKDKKTGEVIRTDWATHIGIKANRLIARRVDRYSYLDNTPRMMTKQEQETIFGQVDPANIWAITKLCDSKGNEAPGYGSWPKDQDVYGADRGNSAANMAFIHSERNALDRLFPGEMPQDVGVIDEQYIEADYKVIQDGHTDTYPPLKSPTGTSLPHAAKAITAPKTARTLTRKKADNEVGEPAERSANQAVGRGGGVSPPAAPSGADEHTLVSTGQDSEMAGAREAAAAGPGFSIPLDWLKQTLKKIKWSEGTTLSWLASTFNIDTTGELTDVITRLDRDQAERFTRYIQEKADRQRPLF